MPTQWTLDRFIARVSSNAHIEALEEFHLHDSTMQENLEPPRVGRDAHIANERRVFARARSITSEWVPPALVNGDHVVIRWVFTFNWLDGTTTRMEELAWQVWRGEMIAAETFFYDPRQRVPAPRA